MWVCPKCEEEIEDQFDSCWKCAGQEQQAKEQEGRKRPLEMLEYIFLMLFIMPGFIAYLNRGVGDRRRALVFDLSVMLVGLVGLIAVKLYQRKKARSGK